MSAMNVEVNILFKSRLWRTCALNVRTHCTVIQIVTISSKMEGV